MLVLGHARVLRVVARSRCTHQAVELPWLQGSYLRIMTLPVGTREPYLHPCNAFLVQVKVL